MGVIARISTMIRAKINDLLNRAEDPGQMMDYAYQRQVEHLRDVRRGIVEVATARRRLELQAATLRESTAKMDEQARKALESGREDLARIALQRKQLALQQVRDLDAQIANLQKQGDELNVTEQRLTSKVEAFRTQREVIKAQYSAAEARVRIGESLTGLSEEMADVDQAVERAREKTEDLQARAGAIDELVSAGTLEELPGGKDIVERELERMDLERRVDQDLEQLKRQAG